MIYDIKNLKFSYSWQGQNVPVLNNIDLQISEASFNCLVGPSGSGKTTLLNLMGLIEPMQAGQLQFLNQNVANLSETLLEKLRLKELGFIFQAFYLIPTLTVLENTSYFLNPLGYSNQQAQNRAEEILELVGLKDHQRKMPLELSGGQRQRVAIARALAKKPKVILADEPTANLDRKTAEDVIQAFKTLQKKENVSFVFSTHDNHLVSYADRVLSLKDGVLC